MTVFVDTSAFFAILDADDAMHAAAAAYFATALESGVHLITSNYVVVETSALTRSRLGAAAFRAFTQDLLPVAEIEWVTPEQHAAATSAALLVGSAGPSLVDCSSFEVMRAFGIRTAFAHDRHFSAAGFESAQAG
jgi:predicted nucleic acid-binding protein